MLMVSACVSAVPEEFQPEVDSHYITVDKTALTFYAEGSASSFNIKTSEEWALTGYDYWLSTSAESGSGSTSVTMTAEPNTSADIARASVFYLNTKDPEWSNTTTMSAEQNAATPYIEFSEGALYIPGTAGTYRVYVDSNTDWRISVSGGDWCNAIGAEDNTYFDINVTENTYGYSRTMFVNLAGAITRTFEVTQQTAAINGDTESIDFPRSGGSYLIKLNAEASWTTYTPTNWIDVSQTEGSAGETEVVISASPNWDTKNRTGYIYFNIGDSCFAITITQERAFISSVASDSLSALGDEYVYLPVIATFPWDVISAPSWLSARKITGGELDGTLEVKAENNSESVSRSGIITIGKEGYSLTYDILITQPGKYFAVNNESLAIGSRGGILKVSVQTNDIWDITLKNEADWLTFSTTSGKESKTVDFIVGDNPSVNTRSATANIAPADVESVDVVVRQEARYLEVDTYGVLLFGKESTSSPIVVSTDGEFAVSTDTDWISISQEGDIFYIHATENTSKFIRYGSVTVRLTDLIEGELSLSISVEQLVRGGNFKKEDFDEDSGWDLNYYGKISFTTLGFNDEEDWSTPSSHGLTVSKTGYTKDENWEGAFSYAEFDKDDYSDDSLVDSKPGSGNINNDNFNNESSYDTPGAIGSGDVGKDNYGNDGSYDNNPGNVDIGKDEHSDDDTYDKPNGTGDMNKEDYSKDDSYDPNTNVDADKDGYTEDDTYDDSIGSGDIDKEEYSDDESYDKPNGSGNFEKEELPEDDTSYDLSEGEGSIDREDFSDEENYDNDNIV